MMDTAPDLEALRSEIETAVPRVPGWADQLALGDAGGDAFLAAFEAYGEFVERTAKVARAAGRTALASWLERVSDQMPALMHLEHGPRRRAMTLFADWPALSIAYLDVPPGSADAREIAMMLASLFLDAPAPISPAEVGAMAGQLGDSGATIVREEIGPDAGIPERAGDVAGPGVDGVAELPEVAEVAEAAPDPVIPAVEEVTEEAPEAIAPIVAEAPRLPVITPLPAAPSYHAQLHAFGDEAVEATTHLALAAELLRMGGADASSLNEAARHAERLVQAAPAVGMSAIVPIAADVARVFGWIALNGAAGLAAERIDVLARATTLLEDMIGVIQGNRPKVHDGQSIQHALRAWLDDIDLQQWGQVANLTPLLEEGDAEVAAGLEIGELMGVIRTEIAGALDLHRGWIAALDASDPDDPAARDAREQLAAFVERTTEAAAMVGLSGLAEALAGVTARVHDVGLLARWPTLVLDYLDAPPGTPLQAIAAGALADTIHGPGADADRLRDHLVARTTLPEALLAEAAANARAQVATDDDVRLDLPDDVDPSLLAAFVADAPAQAAYLGAVADRIAREPLDAATLFEAKRVAHTLKGSANIIGVRGIAQIAHPLEDILEAIEARPGERVRPDLAGALGDAASCLEQMADALRGLDDAPPDATAVLQSLLDWANAIDADAGVAWIADGDAPRSPKRPPEPTPANGTTAMARPVDAHDVEDTVNVPMRTVDGLLQLVGELTVQLGETRAALRRAGARMNDLQRQNSGVQRRLAEVEARIDSQGSSVRRSVDGGLFDPLEFDRYTDLHSAARSLVEEVADTRAIAQAIQSEMAALGTTAFRQEQLNRDLQQLVVSTRMAPALTLAPRLRRNVRQTCQSTGHEADLVIEGDTIRMDSDLLARLAEPLLHLLRNAIDHGIEAPETRLAAGKPRAGRVRLSFARVGPSVQVTLADDGRGLDYPRIRSRAIERGLLAPDAQALPDDLHRVIMLPGFSTREQVTQVSGRGVGLDVVRERLRGLNGEIAIRSRAGEGTTFTLTLPASLVTAHALLVVAGGQTVALPSFSVVQGLPAGAATFEMHDGRLLARVRDDAYPAWSLASLMQGEPAPTMSPATAAAIVIVRARGTEVALLVDRAVDARELLVKPLGPLLQGMVGTSGLAVMGDGAVVPVLDVAELIDAPPADADAGPAAADDAVAHALPIVVVVDDSLSVRRALTQLVGDAGYRVIAARDGVDALRALGDATPAAIVTDLEMPNMNGLELTRHVRADARLAATPVIMITSRAQAKHREQAALAGVTRYLTKPYGELELLGLLDEAIGSIH